MKQLVHLFIVVTSLLILFGCQKEKAEQSAIKESVSEVESGDATSDIQKKVSKEAFVMSKEVESIDPPANEKSSQTKSEVNSTKIEEKKNTELAKKRKPTKKKRPKMTFDSIVHHLPTIIRGETFTHEFKFKNTGDAPLSILLAVPSCGCTLPSFPFLDILPDSSGVIGLEYNSVGKHGRQEAEITITANTRPKETLLKMVFDVLEPEEDNLKKDTLSN